MRTDPPVAVSYISTVWRKSVVAIRRPSGESTASFAGGNERSTPSSSPTKVTGPLVPMGSFQTFQTKMVQTARHFSTRYRLP